MAQVLEIPSCVCDQCQKEFPVLSQLDDHVVTEHQWERGVEQLLTPEEIREVIGSDIDELPEIQKKITPHEVGIKVLKTQRYFNVKPNGSINLLGTDEPTNVEILDFAPLDRIYFVYNEKTKRAVIMSYDNLDAAIKDVATAAAQNEGTEYKLARIHGWFKNAFLWREVGKYRAIPV